VYSDDEDGDDMEAGLDDVEAEERRAAAIARREDEAAEREERERRERKEKLKREKEKGTKAK
jgi:protein SPT2